MARLSDLLRSALIGGANDTQRKLQLEQLKLAQGQQQAANVAASLGFAGQALASAVPVIAKQIEQDDPELKFAKKAKVLDLLATDYAAPDGPDGPTAPATDGPASMAPKAKTPLSKEEAFLQEHPQFNDPLSRTMLRNKLAKDDFERQDTLSLRGARDITADKTRIDVERKAIGSALTLNKDEFIKRGVALAALRDAKAPPEEIEAAKQTHLKQLDETFFSGPTGMQREFGIYTPTQRLKLYDEIIKEVMTKSDPKTVKRFVNDPSPEEFENIRKQAVAQTVTRQINAFKNNKDIEGKPLAAPDVRSLELSGLLIDKLDSIASDIGSDPILMSQYAFSMGQIRKASETASLKTTTQTGSKASLTKADALEKGTTSGDSSAESWVLGAGLGGGLLGASGSNTTSTGTTSGSSNSSTTMKGSGEEFATTDSTETEINAANRAMNDLLKNPDIDDRVKQAVKDTMDISFQLGQAKQEGIMTDADAARFDMIHLPFGDSNTALKALLNLRDEASKSYLEKVENREEEFNVPTNLRIRKERIYAADNKSKRFEKEAAKFAPAPAPIAAPAQQATGPTEGPKAGSKAEAQKWTNDVNRLKAIASAPDVTDILVKKFGLVGYQGTESFGPEPEEDKDVVLWVKPASKGQPEQFVRANPTIKLQRDILDKLGYKPYRTGAK